MSTSDANASPSRESGRGRALNKWTRILLAGPGALIVSFLVLVGMALWYPPGPGFVDNLVIPLVTFPVIWVTLFFFALLDRSLSRVALVFGVLTLFNAALLYQKFS